MKYALLITILSALTLSGCGAPAAKKEPDKFGTVVAVNLNEVKDDATGQTRVEAEISQETAEKSVADKGAESLMTVQRLVTVGQDFENYSVARDGRIVISLYNREGAEGLDVWVFTPGKMRVTKSSHFNFSPSFSSDASKIYFSSKRGRNFWGDFDQYHYIWRVPSSGGGGITRLGYPAYSYEGPVRESPAGQKVLYAAKELGDSDPFIWIADVTGNLPTQISQGLDPSWIDEDTITFVSTDENTELDTIWTQKTNGAQLTQIVSDPEAHCIHPAPSPDGRYIAYAKQDSSDMIAEKSRQQRKRIDPPETRDIYVYDRRTGLSQQLTTNSSRDDMPRWSADGSYLMFRSTRGVGWNIWRVDTSTILSM